MDDVVKVGMADLNMAKSPQKIRTSGLGSCVGLVIYEEKSKLCGMAHVMLPDSSMAKNTTLNKAKYADTAIQELVDRLKQNGANVSMLKAKLAGEHKCSNSQ